MTLVALIRAAGLWRLRSHAGVYNPALGGSLVDSAYRRSARAVHPRTFEATFRSQLEAVAPEELNDSRILSPERVLRCGSKAPRRAVAGGNRAVLPWVSGNMDLVVAFGLSCVTVVIGFLTQRGEHAEALAEATPICPAALLYLGKRAAVDQALSRLARSGRLMRICQGVYMRPIETRFGIRAPRMEKALPALSALWGETIVPCGGAAANWLGLTTQNPVRAVYLTSGPNRRLHFGADPVQLRHARRWQLAAPHRKAGEISRALAWLGPADVEESLDAVLPTLSEEDRDELAVAQAVMPIWMAEPVSARLAHG